MKAYIKRYLPHPFSPASASRPRMGCQPVYRLHGPSGRMDTRRTHSLRYPARTNATDIRSTHTTDEEYNTAEEKINTLRILVFSQDKPVINKQFKEADLSGGSVTIEGCR